MLFQSHLKQPGAVEFIILTASLISLVALSIDAMLPALLDIATELKAENLQDSHFIISLLFLGMGLGQMIFGPVSDAVGRKPAIMGGILIFVAGCLVSYFATSMSAMMVGRFLQGFGLAGPRIVTIALVRDCYQGRQMARVMSFIMSVFILVPVFAPAIGQAVLAVSDWRSIFALLLWFALVTLFWFGLRQPETLPAEKRLRLSFSQIMRDLRKIILIPATTGYTLTMGLIYGAFLGYLSSVQQIFQIQYQQGQLFAVYFGLLATSIGVSMLVNAALVMRYGMRRLSFLAILSIILLSVPFYVLSVFYGGHPPLFTLILYLLLIFFALGLLFGNLNALAMEPLGQVAGLGAAWVGFVSTLISVLFGAAIAWVYDGTIMPLVAGFVILSIAALLSMRTTERLSTAGEEGIDP